MYLYVLEDRVAYLCSNLCLGTLTSSVWAKGIKLVCYRRPAWTSTRAQPTAMQAQVAGLSFSGQHQEKQDLILVLLRSLMPTAAVASLRFHCSVPVFTMPGPAQLACIPPESSCAERTQQRRWRRQRWGAQLAFQGSGEFSHQGITEKIVPQHCT